MYLHKLSRELTKVDLIYIDWTYIKYIIKKPYLETTSSKLVENTKAFEITIIKELGKLTP